MAVQSCGGGFSLYVSPSDAKARFRRVRLKNTLHSHIRAEGKHDRKFYSKIDVTSFDLIVEFTVLLLEVYDHLEGFFKTREKCNI